MSSLRSLVEDIESWIFAQARHPGGSSKGGRFKSTGASKGKAGAGGAGGKDYGGGRTVSREDALATSDKLSVVSGTSPTRVKHPIPMASSDVLPGTLEKGKYLPARNRDAVAAEVPVSKLRYRPGGQENVFLDGVKGKIESRDNKPIQVVQLGEEFVIWDGHHRATEAILTGKRTMQVEVWKGVALG